MLDELDTILARHLELQDQVPDDVSDELASAGVSVAAAARLLQTRC
jgi:hypothetical protein